MSISDPYGLEKRFAYVRDWIEKIGPSKVLDIGCGTGANLTTRLAERFPAVSFCGTDTDVNSLEFARQTYPLKNLIFKQQDDVRTESFDLIIASEVLDHVERPDEFLNTWSRFLTRDGIIIITVPNGYGPFEIMSWIESLFHLSGVYRILKYVLSTIRGSRATTPSREKDTLAISPHINFFSYSNLRTFFVRHGFCILEYKGRSLFCGFGFDHVFQVLPCGAWNTRLADALPPPLISGWMFALRRSGAGAVGSAYIRTGYARMRRYLNERRWGLI
jgi:SAM-dependent methyltransferase